MSETVGAERVLDRAAKPGRRTKISVEGLAKCFTVGGSVHEVLGDVNLRVGENVVSLESPEHSISTMLVSGGQS